MWIRALRSVLRAPEGEGGSGGAGGGDSGGGASEVAALKAELAALKAKEADASKKAKDAETAAAKAGGEIDKLVKRYEDTIGELGGKLSEATAKLEGIEKQSRQAKLTEAVAAKLGITVSPVLVGLLPQTGEDVAPEKITDAHVQKVAEMVRKLAPDLKQPIKAAPGPGGKPPKVFATDEEGWRAHARRMAGREE